MERIKLLLIVLLAAGGFFIPAYSDNTKYTPSSVKAVNLSPIETKTPEVKAVNLSKPRTPQNNLAPLKVQAVPVNTKSESVKVQAVPVNSQNENDKPVYQPPVQLAEPNGQGVNSLTVPVDIQSEACNKIFNIECEELFNLTLAAIIANNFSIEELQTKGGYIEFKAASKEFLAIISEVDNKNSILKITPTNGVYHFAPGIVYKIFEYISLKTK